MLKNLSLTGVGPADAFGPVDFAPRLNFITGDNGLGKSFLLDIAWWALTRTWARGIPVVPPKGKAKSTISYAYSKSTPGDFAETSSFKRAEQQWPTKPGRPAIPGVVIYAGVDGSFSAWDPARNYWQGEGSGRTWSSENSWQSGGKWAESAERARAFNFTPEQVWNGLEGPNGIRYCNGLIHDWVLWQKGQDPAFADLCKVLEALSASDDEQLVPGQPVRLGLDVKDYPSLHMPYGQDVALVHASAGMRRIAALAYLLVWTWREHQLACEQTGRKQAKEIIFLVDEIECHLHPQWQRRVVPALLRVMQALTGKKVPVQLIVATHSPLVLASVEPEFDEDKDAVFNIQLDGGQAQVTKERWAKQGDVVNWLVSDAFGLRQARSIDAERAIEAAEAWMRGDKTALPSNLKTQTAIHKELLRVLAGHDDFWPRWLVETQQIPGSKSKGGA